MQILVPFFSSLLHQLKIAHHLIVHKYISIEENTKKTRGPFVVLDGLIVFDTRRKISAVPTAPFEGKPVSDDDLAGMINLSTAPLGPGEDDDFR